MLPIKGRNSIGFTSEEQTTTDIFKALKQTIPLLNSMPHEISTRQKYGREDTEAIGD
jgi:hypothetical protein